MIEIIVEKRKKNDFKAYIKNDIYFFAYGKNSTYAIMNLFHCYPKYFDIKIMKVRMKGDK